MDGRNTMEEMVLGAIKKEMDEICFTDHVDFEHENAMSENIKDAVGYINHIKKMQQKYGDKINIKIGAEIGLQAERLKECKAYAQKGEFDFILGSFHVMDMLDIHSGVYGKGKTGSKAITRYLEGIYECARMDFSYSVIGHYDYIKRYVSHNGEAVFRENYDLIKDTFEYLIENGKGIEINTSGTRYGLENEQPSWDILELYHSLGGEIITTGSDAHKVADLGHNFDYVTQRLKDIGFKYITKFEKMKPVFIKIH